MKFLKISFLLGLIFVMSIQPMFMIGVLMLVVVIYSLEIYFMSLSFWFGYILMLILLSGVLVVFTYVVSLIPNESFEYFSLLMVLASLMFFWGVPESIVLSTQSFVSILMWEGVMGGYMLYLAIFLLSIMVMVIFISFPFDGALRMF